MPAMRRLWSSFRVELGSRLGELVGLGTMGGGGIFLRWGRVRVYSFWRVLDTGGGKLRLLSVREFVQWARYLVRQWSITSCIEEKNVGGNLGEFRTCFGFPQWDMEFLYLTVRLLWDLSRSQGPSLYA